MSYTSFTINLKKIYFGILLFILTFGPKFLGWIDFIALVSFFLFIYYFIIIRKPINSLLLRSILPLLILLLHCFFLTIKAGSTDFFYLYRTSRSILNILGVYALCELYWQTFGSFSLLLMIDTMFWVITVHAVIMILMYLYPDFGKFVYNLTLSMEPQAKIFIGWRVTGLTEGLGTTSVTQSIGILLAPILLSTKSHLIQRIIVYPYAVIIIFLSIMISGRTGLFLSIPYFIVGIGLIFFIQKRHYFSTISHFLIGLVFILIIGQLFIFNILPKDAIWRWKHITLPHAFEGFYSLKETGNFRIKSFEDVIEDQFFLPSDVVVFIFGTGESGREDSSYLPSDVGYVRFIFGIGLVGSILAYSFYLVVLIYALRILSDAPVLGVITITSTIGYLIAHAKTIVILTRNGLTVTSLLLSICIIIIQKNIKMYKVKNNEYNV